MSDRLADPDELRREHELELKALDGGPYDLVVGAVPHEDFRELTADQVERLLKPGGLLADIKGMWRDREFSSSVNRLSL